MTADLAADLERLLDAATDPERTGGAERSDGGTISADQAAAAWQMVATSEHVDVETGVLEQPIVTVTDWHGVMRTFGLDPAEFEVVDDTVKMSRWQQSKRTEDGDRDVVWLHSYKARFRRIQNRVPEEDVAALRREIRAFKLPRRSPGTGLGAPATFYTGWSDWQFGKGEGGGYRGTQARILDSFEQTHDRIRDLRKIGRNIESLSVWNMGDPNEGCDSNYPSQLNTVELNRRQQLTMVLDLWTKGLEFLAPLAEDVEFGSVLCNHGEWTRQGFGTKAVTDDSDNIGGYLAETLQRVLTGKRGTEHIRWAIPDDQMVMHTVMSGVPVALAHGHKAPGSAKELEWLRGQSIKAHREIGREPRLWFTAHRHHYEVKDYGAWHRIQHPSLDFGSKYYTDTSGLWSTPGTFTCLVGEHEQAGGPLAGHGVGFSDEMVLKPRVA
jgi:hypothetical protein